MVSLSAPSDRRVPLSSGMPDELARVVYAEVRRLARRHLRRAPARGWGARTTSLVHEAWLRMQGRWSLESGPDPAFAAMVAAVLRSLLVDEARHRLRLKRGGGWQRVGIEGAAKLPAPLEPLEEILDLDESLQTLQQFAPRQARVVELRYFGGLTVADAARALEVGERTVEEDWRLAKAWLRARLDRARVARVAGGGPA